MAIAKTGNIHVDAAALYYDQLKAPLAALQQQAADLTTQLTAVQQQIKVAIPADASTRMSEFTVDLAAYFITKNAANAAKLAGFFVGAIQSQSFSSILDSVDGYLAAGGV